MVDKAILCVDDEAILLMALTYELRKNFGDTFIYEKAINADEAFGIIEDIKKEGIPLIMIISDWLMPGIKGDEFLEIIHEKYPEIKAIMITGHADLESLEKVKANQSVIGILKKPWDALELKNLISSII